MAKIDWIIHCCANGVVCDGCNKVETGFLKNTCNAHTHGMEKWCFSCRRKKSGVS